MLPAYAGMILTQAALSRYENSAPRVCGDDPGTIKAFPGFGHVLPAYAGMIRRGDRPLPALRRAPRVCGDDPSYWAAVWAVAACSPRMRG